MNIHTAMEPTDADIHPSNFVDFITNNSGCFYSKDFINQDASIEDSDTKESVVYFVRFRMD